MYCITLSLQQYQAWLGEIAESDSQEEEGGVVRSKPVLHNRTSQGFDYLETANSASTVSTPPNDPFASDDLGETVIKLNKAVTLTGGGNVPSTASPLKTDASEALPDTVVRCD